MSLIRKLLSKLSNKQNDKLGEEIDKITIKSITTKLKTTKAPKKRKSPAKSKRVRLHNLQKPSKRPPHKKRPRNGSKGK